jgi:hypothetical protein
MLRAVTAGIAVSAVSAVCLGAGAGAGADVTVRLAPGLSDSEHAALERAGAYGPRPVRLLIVGDSIAMTLGMGLTVESRPEYGSTG